MNQSKNFRYAEPTPQNVTNQYQVTYQPIIKQGKFDQGARFDGTNVRIPPPPPGVQATQAQINAQMGIGTNIEQTKKNFWTDKNGGGTTMGKSF